jgi:glycosyltransferase involved in cell wall biosynthesis
VNPLTEIPALFRFAKIFRAEQPDLIMNFSIKPVIYAGVAANWVAPNIPVISMITGLGYVFIGDEIKQRYLRVLVKRLYKWSLRNSKIVFFQNRNDSELFVRNGMVREDQARVLAGTGINLEEFSPDTAKRFSGSFLFIGRLLKDKGVYELVQASAKLKRSHRDLKVVLLGPVDDNPAAISQEQVRQWQEEGIVEYLGNQPDVRPYIRNADVIVLPSYREGLPRSTLEAMAMGKPIITTDVPGCRETVENEKNGYLIPAADVSALADSMAKFLDSPGRAREFGIRSRELAVKKYDVNHVVAEILAGVKQFLENVRQGGSQYVA